MPPTTDVFSVPGWPLPKYRHKPHVGAQDQDDTGGTCTPGSNTQDSSSYLPTCLIIPCHLLVSQAHPHGPQTRKGKPHIKNTIGKLETDTHTRYHGAMGDQQYSRGPDIGRSKFSPGLYRLSPILGCSFYLKSDIRRCSSSHQYALCKAFERMQIQTSR